MTIKGIRSPEGCFLFWCIPCPPTAASLRVWSPGWTCWVSTLENLKGYWEQHSGAVSFLLEWGWRGNWDSFIRTAPSSFSLRLRWTLQRLFKANWENSLEVQRLRLQVSTTEDMGLIPAWGTKILQAEQHSQKNIEQVGKHGQLENI